MTAISTARKRDLGGQPGADKMESVVGSLPPPARLHRTSLPMLARAVVRLRWDVRCRRHRIEDAERELETMRMRQAAQRDAADRTFAELSARDIREAHRVDEWTSSWCDGPDGPVANLPHDIRKAVR